MYECFPECVSVCQVLAWCPWRPEKGVHFPGTGITYNYEPSCSYWESNQGPLKAASALNCKPSLQPLLALGPMWAYGGPMVLTGPSSSQTKSILESSSNLSYGTCPCRHSSLHPTASGILGSLHIPLVGWLLLFPHPLCCSSVSVWRL